MFNNKSLAMLILLSLIFGFFFESFTGKEFKAFSLKVSDVSGPQAVELPDKDRYVLAVWNPSLPDAVSFNNRLLKPVSVSKRKLYTAYYILEEKDVVAGFNKLIISGHGPYSLRIKNFIAGSKFGNVYVLDKLSRFITGKSINFKSLFLGSLAAVFFLAFLWLGMSFLGSKSYFLFLVSLAPCILVFSSMKLAEKFSGFRLIFSKGAFAGLAFFLVIVAAAPILFRVLFIKSKSQKTADAAAVLAWLKPVFDYVSEGTGNIFFVLFMFLLFLTAVLIIFKMDVLAELVINAGYIVLLSGLGIKAFKRFKNGKN